MAHRISNEHPDTRLKGIYIEGEIAGLDSPIFVSELTFPALRGISNAQRISNLEADLNSTLDLLIPSSGSQRIRVHIFSLGPPIDYVFGIFSDEGAITSNWWA